MKEYIAGVDPGKSGGIVLLAVTKGRYEIEGGWKMSPDDDENVEIMLEVCSKVSAVYVEQIPKFAGENRSAAYMCVLYGNYRLVAGSVLMHQRLKVTPRLVEMPLLLWMNQIIPSVERSRNRAERKRQLMLYSQQKWPEWKWTTATCDAPLIAMAGHLLGR